MLRPRPITVLDKTITNGEELYLVQRLGEHKLNAKWLQRDAIIQQYPGAKSDLTDYDRELETRCKILKNNEPPTRRKKNSEHSSSSRSSSSRQRLRRNKPRRHHDKQTFERAKADINAKQGNKTIPADNFVLYINTPVKLESNWVFGDSLKKVLEKTNQQPSYKVMWQDGSSSLVTENDLIQRDPRRFCEFWEKKLGLTKWAKMSQSE